MKWLKTYWAEIVVFGAIFSIFMIDLEPGYTFMCKAADSLGYIFSAKYIYPSYHSSPPLYLLTSHLFLQLPFGSDAWKMALVSVLSSMGACVFIYLIIKKLTQSKWYALLGVLIYGTSAIVISQTIVVQTYATVCLTATGAYYFSLKKQWKLVGLMVGIGLAVHLLMGFVLLIMLGYKEYRKNWKALLITASFGIFYIYMPLTNRPPYMWFPDPNTVNPIVAFVTDTISTIDFVVGSLAIWDFPKRILDTIGLVGVSISVVTIIPIVYYFRHSKIWSNPLFWLSMFPIILFATELDMNTYDYTMVAIPFLAIIACVGLNWMATRYSYKNMAMKALTVLTWLSVIGFGMFNLNFFDIGRTCFPAGTKIIVRRKKSVAKQIPDNTKDAESIEKLKIGDEVLSFNISTGRKEYKPITHIYTNKSSDFMLVQFSNGNEIRCTPEHPIAVDNAGKISWVKASELKIDDKCIQYKYGRLKQRLHNISIRGTKIEQRYGVDKAQELRKSWSNKHHILRNDKTSTYHTKQYSEMMSSVVSSGYKEGIRVSWNTGLTKDNDERVNKCANSIKKHYEEHPELISSLSKRQKTKWQNPSSYLHSEEYWEAYRNARNNKPTKLESKVMMLLDKAFPKNWIYTGNYTYPIQDPQTKRRRFPDFKHQSFNKLIEAFNPFDKIRKYGTIKRFKQITTRFYHKVGYEVTYLSYNDVFKTPDKVVEKIRNYTYNPEIRVVSVINVKRIKTYSETVYNIAVEGNNNYYAYGILVHNCDPNMSAERAMKQEFNKIPDGAIFMPNYAMEWEAIYLYNADNGKHIYPICMDILPSSNYRNQLRKDGIQFVDSTNPNYSIMGRETAQSIVAMNEVWTTVSTIGETMQTDVVNANHDISLVEILTEQKLHEIADHPKILWKPYAPYDVLSNSIAQSQWRNQLLSTWNVRFFACLGIGGWFITWLYDRMARKRKERTDANTILTQK